jgi:hypothetical protein
LKTLLGMGGDGNAEKYCCEKFVFIEFAIHPFIISAFIKESICLRNTASATKLAHSPL